MKKIIEKAPWVGGILVTIPALPAMLWTVIGFAVLALNFIYWKKIQGTKTVIIASGILSLVLFVKEFLSILEEFVVNFGITYTPFPRSLIILCGAVWSLYYSLTEYKRVN